MARSRNKLTDVFVRTTKIEGRHSDGDRLYLQVTDAGTKSWVFRWKQDGKQRIMGLGPYPAVSLASARAKAGEYREDIAHGRDPKIERERITGVTFGHVAEEYIAAHRHNWRNSKSEHQWRKTLFETCSSLVERSIVSLVVEDIVDVMKPNWYRTPTTSQRALQRIHRVFQFAKAKKWYTNDNPAAYQGSIEYILPAKKTKATHHKAMEYTDIAKFMVQLKARSAQAARALELTILTATRTTEALEAKWEEIDLEKCIWTIPAERKKEFKGLKIPLSSQAIQLLYDMKRSTNDATGYIFSGNVEGKPLSNMSMLMLLRRMGIKDVTVHGFRSTFSDWAGDETSHEPNTVEYCLGHNVGNTVARAYKQKDGIRKRTLLMQDWSNFVSTIGEADNVVHINRSKNL